VTYKGPHKNRAFFLHREATSFGFKGISGSLNARKCMALLVDVKSRTTVLQFLEKCPTKRLFLDKCPTKCPTKIGLFCYIKMPLK